MNNEQLQIKHDQPSLESHFHNDVEKVFLSYVSHRIRTPLNSIIGFSKLLINGNLSPSRREEFAEMIMDSGYEILHYFENILDSSEMESGLFSPTIKMVDINQVITGIEGEYKDRGFIKKSVQIQFRSQISERYKYIFTDEFIVRRITQNLIELLIKFLARGKVKVIYEVEAEHLFISVLGKSFFDLASSQETLDDSLFCSDRDSLEYISLNLVKNLVNILQGKFTIEKQCKGEVALKVQIPHVK